MLGRVLGGVEDAIDNNLPDGIVHAINAVEDHIRLVVTIPPTIALMVNAFRSGTFDPALNPSLFTERDFQNTAGLAPSPLAGRGWGWS